MRRYAPLLVLLIVLITTCSAHVLAAPDAPPVCAFYFTGIGCTHCAETDPLVLGEWLEDYPSLVVIEYELYEHDGNAAVYDSFVNEYGAEYGTPLFILTKSGILRGVASIREQGSTIIQQTVEFPFESETHTVSFDACIIPELSGTPTIWYQDKILVKTGQGGEDHLLKDLLTSEDLASALEGHQYECCEPIEISRATDRVSFDHAVRVEGWVFQWRGEDLIECGSAPGVVTGQDLGAGTDAEGTLLTVPKIIALALVDAVNPCAMAVLTLVLLGIMTSDPLHPRRVLWAGLAFSGAVFVAYTLYGIMIVGFFSLSGIFTSWRPLVSLFLGIFALLLGAFQLHDALAGGSAGYLSHMPGSFRGRVYSIIKRISSVPAAFGLGILVTLFLLPCTIGPYIIAGGILSSRGIAGSLPFLVLYNTLFILPMLAITVIIASGFRRIDSMNKWRSANLSRLHAISGIILSVLGVGLLTGAF